MEQKRKLIRRIAVFLVIAVIFGSVGSYNCKRAEAENNIVLPVDTGKKEADMCITTDMVNCKKGDIITLTLIYTGTEPINGVDCDVNLDNSLLKPYNCEPIGRLCDILHCYDDYFIIHTGGNTQNYIREGEQFVNLQFQCLEDIDKESIIKFTTVNFYFPSGGEYFYEEGYSIKINPTNMGR